MKPETTARDILSPTSVAVVGVSSNPMKIGARIYANIVNGGFTGRRYPIHPAGMVIDGEPTYRSLDAIPGAVDLVVVAVPASAVAGVVDAAIERNARAIVVISSGFAEVGDAGRSLEQRIVARVRGSGARLIGPNCFGVINADPAIRLHATFGQLTGNGGTVAFASQSGAVGILILNQARDYGFGVRAFVSLGNSADLTVHELLELWGDDPAIDVVAVYLEGLTGGADLVRVGRKVSARKPIFALTAGRTIVGSKAASSHTAAMASSSAGMDAVLESAGIVRVESIEALLQAIHLATEGGIPWGARVGVVTNSGGPGIIFADRGAMHELHFPPLSAEGQMELRPIVSKEASLLNPIDLTAAASPAQIEATVRVLAREVDIIVVIAVDIGLTPIERCLEALRRCGGEDRAGIRFILILPSGADTKRLEIESGGFISVLSTVTGGADGVAAIVRAYRLKMRSKEPPPEKMLKVAALRELVGSWVGDAPERWLRWGEIEELLTLAEIPCVRGWEGSLDEVDNGTQMIGYPLVAKLVLPDVIHKSDIGGVVTGIPDEITLRETITQFAQIAARYRREARVILQPFISGGREGFIGITVDPYLGPLIGCGWGGVLVEALRDTEFIAPPIALQDAERAIDRLRFRRLLEPFRGAPPHDRRSFEDIIVRLGALASVVPEIIECDLNPVRIFPEGEGCLVIDARVRVQRR